MAACHKGPQDAFAHVVLHGSDGALIKISCRMKNYTLRCRCRTRLWVGLCSSVQAALKLQASSGDQMTQLRSALSPLSSSAKKLAQKLLRFFSGPGQRMAKPLTEPSTYLGTLL